MRYTKIVKHRHALLHYPNSQIYRIRHCIKKIKNTGNKIKDTGYRINDTGYWIHDIGYFRKRISFPRSKYTWEDYDGRRTISKQLHYGSKLSSTMINYVYTLFKFVGWPKCTDSTDFFL